MSRKNIAFIGLGLIGGSFARCLRKRTPEARILAYTRTRSTLIDALDDGLIDQALEGPDDPALSSCDMIILCAPVESNIRSLEIMARAGLIPEGCLVTDVGSVKTGIHRAARALGLTDRFIGGHPMAGSEKSGLAASNDHLFENAYYIMTPEADVPEALIREYHDLVNSFMAIPLIISCEQHDRIVAAISHLPHVIASALVNTVHNLDTPQEYMKQIAAGGFKDITRIASSSPEMWEQICIDNHENISAVMDEFLRLMNQARDAMNGGDGRHINRMFAESRTYRDSFSDTSAGSIRKSYRLYCDIIDEAGAIATIATILAVGRISIKNIGIVHNRDYDEGALRIEFYDAQSLSDAAGLLRHHRYQVWEV